MYAALLYPLTLLHAEKSEQYFIINMTEMKRKLKKWMKTAPLTMTSVSRG
jgi:hypothetical protein